MFIIFILIISPIAGIFVSLLFPMVNLMRKRYLNRYFYFSKVRKETNVFELHHGPVCGFYNGTPKKFLRLSKHAIEKFYMNKPEATLIAHSQTLNVNKKTASSQVIKVNALIKYIRIFVGCVFIFTNLYHIKRRKLFKEN